MTDHDPLDELLASGHDAASDALRAIRGRYAGQPAPPVSARLAEFTDLDPTIELAVNPNAAAARVDDTRPMPLSITTPGWSTNLRNRSHRTMRLISTFLATVTGKILVGFTVAAASVAGAQAAGVIDVVPGPSDTKVVVDDPADPADIEADELDDDDQGDDDQGEDVDGDEQGDDDQGEDIESDDVESEDIEADEADDDQGEDVDGDEDLDEDEADDDDEADDGDVDDDEADDEADDLEDAGDE